MVAVIDFDAYPFLVYSDLISLPEDAGIGISGCTVLSDSKETELESRNSTSAGKKRGIFSIILHIEMCP